MPGEKNKLVFVSMSDKANGAESILLMGAYASNSPLIFLKRSIQGGLKIPDGVDSKFVTDKSMLIGFIGLLKLLKPYKSGYIIISSHPYLNAYLGFLKRMSFIKSRLIVRECTSVFIRYKGFKKWSYQLAYRLGYPAANLVVCQTNMMREIFLKNAPFVDGKKVIVQKNPVDVEQNIIKSNLPLDDADTGTNYICAAGRLIPEKGFYNLISAFNEIESHYPDLKLLIFGEGPEKNSLEKLIKTYRLQHRVILKGWTDNPMPYFKHAKVCVVSSLKEGFPNVLLQMMCLNPVIVCTKCAGGIEDIPGIFKAEVNNINALLLAIGKALKSNTDNQMLIRHYIQNRSPEIFISSILKALV